MRISRILLTVGVAVMAVAMTTMLGLVAFDATGPTFEIAAYAASAGALVGGLTMGFGVLFMEPSDFRRSSSDITSTRISTSHPSFLQRFASVIHWSRRRGSMLPDPAIPI